MLVPLWLALLSGAFAAPLIKARGNAISGKYIVKLKGDVSTQGDDDLMSFFAATPDHTYSITGFRGFASSLSADEVAKLQAADQVRPAKISHGRKLRLR